jgi:hypothetical protein
VPLALASQLVAVIATIAAAPSGSTAIDGRIYVPAGAGTATIDTAHLLGLALTVLVGVFAAGVALRIFGDVAAGSAPSSRAALRFAWSRFGCLLWLAILYAAVVAGGTLLLILPGIYIAIACTAAFPALAAEDKRGLRALDRAHKLSQGRWWATLGAMAPSWVLAVGGAFIVTSALRVSGSVTTYALTQALGGLVVQVLLVPVATAASVAVYLDLRARREPLPVTSAPLAAVPAASPPGDFEHWWS